MRKNIITAIWILSVVASFSYIAWLLFPTDAEYKAKLDKLYAQPVGCVLKETHIPITNYGHYNKYDCKGVITWVKEKQ